MNEVYAGHLVQKKTTMANYKVKKRLNVPEDKQIRVLNTHEAIIPQSKFSLIQEMISKNTYSRPTNDGKKRHILAD